MMLQGIFTGRVLVLHQRGKIILLEVIKQNAAVFRLAYQRGLQRQTAGQQPQQQQLTHGRYPGRTRHTGSCPALLSAMASSINWLALPFSSASAAARLVARPLGPMPVKKAVTRCLPSARLVIRSFCTPPRCNASRWRAEYRWLATVRSLITRRTLSSVKKAPPVCETNTVNWLLVGNSRAS